MVRRTIVAWCLSSALVVSGCSSFEAEWLAAKTPDPPEGSLAGAWEGRWISESSGHDGGLRCIITETEQGVYDAWYEATWRFLFVFSPEYTLPMEVTQEERVYRFVGECNLGWFLGTYRYSGEATDTHFTANYTTANDHGSFEMERVLSQ